VTPGQWLALGIVCMSLGCAWLAAWVVVLERRCAALADELAEATLKARADAVAQIRRMLSGPVVEIEGRP
jgi:hypothetical protein